MEFEELICMICSCLSYETIPNIIHWSNWFVELEVLTIRPHTLCGRSLHPQMGDGGGSPRLVIFMCWSQSIVKGDWKLQLMIDHVDVKSL